MKKTLIALATVAAATGAFAQSSVTISGKLGFGVQGNDNSAAGIAVTDGDIVFTAVEDLGGGLKATASMAMLLRGRDTSAAGGVYSYAYAEDSAGNVVTDSEKYADLDRLTGRDASLALEGGFGKVMIGAVEAGNGIMGNGMGGAPISLPEGFDSSKVGLLAAPSNVNILQYTSPELMAGLKVQLTRTDGINNNSTYSYNYITGTSKSTDADVNNDFRGATQSNGVGLTYAAGPLAAAVDYTDYSGATKSRTRASASYDFGMFKVGAGIQQQSGTKNQTVVGASMPVGAATLGLAYAKNGGETGWAAAAQYALSKTTNVNVSYGDYETYGAQYRVRLLKSF